jgi:hypothetical protein
MVDVVPSHLDALEAQLRLALVQLEALRQTLASRQTPSVTPAPLPERCASYEPGRCMLQDAEGVSSGGFGSKTTMCPGCGVEAN